MGIGQLSIKKKSPPVMMDGRPIEEPPFIMNPQGKIAIVDGDVLCYHACPPRDKMYIDEGVQLVQLGEDGRRVPREYSEEENAAYLEQAWGHLQYNLKTIADKLNCDDTLVAIGGGGNFRQVLFPDYKVHRHRNNAFKNETVPVLRKRAIEAGLAVYAEGIEADDLIRIWAEEARRIGQDYIICSVDKDLLCIPGQHYLMHKGKEQVVYISEMDAARHYHEQLLKGDSTDNIPGVPGIGPVKATRLLSECTTVEEMQAVVAGVYFDFYGEDEWKNNLLINGKLIHILAYPADNFTLNDWGVVRNM